MVNSVLKTKIKFFEENTQGRILNRFSKDVAAVDRIIFTFLDMTDVSNTSFCSLFLNNFILIVFGKMHYNSDHNHYTATCHANHNCSITMVLSQI
jgi:ABC-type multidrug transport system fused ATPase/permease subunit